MLPTKFQLAFRFRRRSEKQIFKLYSCHLGFPIGMIFVICHLQVAPMLPTNFQVNWPFDSGEEAKNRFSRRRTILDIFYLQVTPILPTKFQVNFSFGSGEEAKNRFSRWPLWRPSWIFDRHDFSSFFYLQVPPMLPTNFRVNLPRGVGGVVY